MVRGSNINSLGKIYYNLQCIKNVKEYVIIIK